jgi:hypothetical protein
MGHLMRAPWCGLLALAGVALLLGSVRLLIALALIGEASP